MKLSERESSEYAVNFKVVPENRQNESVIATPAALPVEVRNSQSGARKSTGADNSRIIQHPLHATLSLRLVFREESPLFSFAVPFPKLTVPNVGNQPFYSTIQFLIHRFPSTQFPT